MPIIRNPKRPSTLAGGSWYSYYAGYSKIFVADVLNHMALPDGALVLDPWNGSGTTAKVAAEMGIRAIGYDLNPVMGIIASARFLSSEGAQDVLVMANQAVVRNPPVDADQQVHTGDPLELWLVPSSVRIIRELERKIRETLALRAFPEGLHDLVNNPLGSFMYVALFRCVAALLGKFQPSNPAWIKAPRSLSQRLRPSQTTIHNGFLASVQALLEELRIDQGGTTIAQEHLPSFGTASSVNLPLERHSIHGVVTSPPYCTRLDYAMATRVELAVLGYGPGPTLKHLRDSMIGTPTIRRIVPDRQDGWGEKCLQFLDEVEGHESKASSSYYLKGFLQYFDSVFRSLQELQRVVVPTGHIAIVVQDSFYKDKHLDLPGVYKEMGTGLGWTMIQKQDYLVKNNIAQVNPGSRVYRRKTTATESALLFRTSGGEH